MEMEYNILVKKSTVCSLQVSHTGFALPPYSYQGNKGRIMLLLYISTNISSKSIDCFEFF